MTNAQALTQALVLALTAPDDLRANKAAELAESIAQGLNAKQVEQCKLDALEMIGENP
jgi:thiamine monophosphate kinase